MWRVIRALLTMVLVCTGLSVAMAGTASATSCATGWGSLPKSAPAGHYESLKNIRTGSHACYDRIVFDVPGAASGHRIGYHISYVDELRQDGSGTPIPVRGGAIIELRVAAPSYDPETGKPTYNGKAGQPLPGVNLTGYPTFRDTRFAASFEGETQIGLGVRARLPFRVFQLGDDRLVVDVAHSWTATPPRR